MVEGAPSLPAERKRIGLDTNLFIYFLEGPGALPCST
jgi:hypothetical protein